MRHVALGMLLSLTVAALVALGLWQLQRRTEKLALIARVESGLAAAPVPAPGPAGWPAIGPGDAYRRVTVRGEYRYDRETYVQAVTLYGPGFWLMTPMAVDRGFTVLINRGFVDADHKRAASRTPSSKPETVSGLLRTSEPGGGFLHANRPGEDRWYSRDVAAIAARRSLGRVAPYYVDDAAPAGTGWPKSGLTVVTFPNNHLHYAITWFVMAALLAGAGLRMAWRKRRG